jgi:hypothetical protein
VADDWLGGYTEGYEEALRHVVAPAPTALPGASASYRSVRNVRKHPGRAEADSSSGTPHRGRHLRTPRLRTPPRRSIRQRSAF